MRKPSAYVFLRASLSDDLTGLEIADWLKTAPPKNVTAVGIEGVVTKARRLQGLVDNHAFPASSIFGKLSLAAKQEILRQFRGLDTVMSTAADYARDPVAETDSAAIGRVLGDMQDVVSTVCMARKYRKQRSLSRTQKMATRTRRHYNRSQG